MAVKAVIIGFSHMHVNEIALYIDETEGMELCAAADVPSDTEAIAPKRYTPVWNLQNVRDNYCSNIYDDYKQMLDEVKPEIAFILTENSRKLEVVTECAKRGVNVSIEKPVALSFEQAKKMKAVVKEYGIEAVVNWPVAWRDYLYKVKNALDSGVVGKPIKLRYINGHTGPLGKGAKHRGVSANAEEMTDDERGKTWWHKADHGGGVYLDICCYGAYFTKWLMGDGEQSVMSYGANLNTPFGNTDDNFAAIVKYADKMSVLEGTWTTPRAVIPSGPMVVCTDGVVMCTGGAENAPDVKAYDMYGNEIEIPDADLGVEFKNMPCHYVHHIETGEPVFDMLTLDKNVEIMAIIDSAAKSSVSGKEEKICD